MTRDEVQRYDVFDDIYDDKQEVALPNGNWVRYEDHAKALTAVEAERDAHLALVVEQNVRIQALESTLAALREPSEAVVDAVFMMTRETGLSGVMSVIPTAVKAAEQEVAS